MRRGGSKNYGLPATYTSFLPIQPTTPWNLGKEKIPLGFLTGSTNSQNPSGARTTVYLVLIPYLTHVHIA